MKALQEAIVAEVSQLFDADCGLRLSSPGHGWHEPSRSPSPVTPVR